MSVSDNLKNRLHSALRTPEARDEMATILDAQIAKVAANVVELDATVGATYNQVQVQAIANKIDAVIAALVAAGLMEAP